MLDIKSIQKMQKEFQDRLGKAQEDLKGRTVEASSGGGMVTATVNGSQELVALKIKPEAVDPDDLEMLEDLVIAAVNSALEKAHELRESELTKITGGLNLNIPGLF